MYPTYGTYRVEKPWTVVLAAVSKTASMADAEKVGAVVIERIIFHESTCLVFLPHWRMCIGCDGAPKGMFC